MSIFTPRLDYTGTDTLDYYTIYNPFYTMYDYDYTPPQYLWMPNCVAMAYGRWNEIDQLHALPSPRPWPVGNGYDWWLDAPSKGLQRGTTPQLGAAMVFSYNTLDGQPGHVGIVEQINRDSLGNITSIITSNSAFNSYQPPRYPQNDFPWFYLSGFYPSDYNYDFIQGATVGNFVGFVYHPKFPPGTTPILLPQLVTLLIGNDHPNIYVERRRTHE